MTKRHGTTISAGTCPANSPPGENDEVGDFHEAAKQSLQLASGYAKVRDMKGSLICPKNIRISRVSRTLICEMGFRDSSRWS